jgi:hypothetical protein
MLRTIGVLLALAGMLSAQDWSLARLFTRPFLWGTLPTQIAWAKRAHTL